MKNINVNGPPITYNINNNTIIGNHDVYSLLLHEIAGTVTTTVSTPTFSHYIKI
jgi:hypothetical protein